MTRRRAVLLGLGLPAALAVPARAFDDREFWNHKDPSDWTASEVKQMLTQSPWAKEASVYNNTGRAVRLGRPDQAAATVGVGLSLFLLEAFWTSI